VKGSCCSSLSVAFILFAFIVTVSPAPFAREGWLPEPHDLWTAWGLEPGIIGGLAVAGFLYYRGARRVWGRSAGGRGVRHQEAISFAIGWLALAIALVSPLKAWSGALFSAHVAQSQVLMLIAAPMLALGRPLVAFLWAAPAQWRRRLVRLVNGKWIREIWQWITAPGAAWLTFAVVVWLWHAPAFFQAALRSDLVHTAQSFCLLFSALLFFEALIYGPDKRMGYGAAGIYVWTAGAQTGALGSLLALAPETWYPAYQPAASAWGIMPLQDQQLGGLMMLVPAGLVYVVAGMVLFITWLRESKQTTVQLEEAFLLDADLWRSREWLNMNQDRMLNPK
jgi:putative membrane protein